MLKLSDSENLGSNKLREGFVSLSEALLTAVHDVFPECQSTDHVLKVFRTFVKGDPNNEDVFLRKCHKIFKKHSAEIKARDPEAVYAISEELDMIKSMDLRKKWNDPDFAEESRMNLWTYVANLETYANLYCCVPPNTMGKIEDMALKVTKQMRGENLENLDIGNFGKEIMSSMTPQDIADLEGNLPDIYACVGNVAGMLGHGTESGSKIDVEGLIQKLMQSQTDGAPDISGLLSNLQGTGAGIDPSQLASLAQKLGGLGKGDNIDMSNLMEAVTSMAQSQNEPSNIFSIEDKKNNKNRKKKK